MYGGKQMKKSNLNVYLIAETNFTNQEKFPEFETPAEKFNYFGGLNAGICYMPGTYEDLRQKPLETTLKRAEGTKAGGHHSVFEHAYVSLYLENIPKLFAMLLNNEKTYVTSEKSARYTKMQMQENEEQIYNKWCNIFENEIKSKYPCEQYLDERRIKKLAQENARYFLSVYTPTNMEYTVSFRQLNYLYFWLKQNQQKGNRLTAQIQNEIDDFCTALEDLKLIDEKLANDQKDRWFSLFAANKGEKYFGSKTYSTFYNGSFAQLAQAQRHRTINYEMIYQNNDKFYVPKLIGNNESLVGEWLSDMQKVKSNIPQGKLLTITETGTPQDLILKAKERNCTCAQLEIDQQTRQTIKEYAENCRDLDTKELMQQHQGSRCTFPDYTCPTPCHFPAGVKGEREI